MSLAAPAPRPAPPGPIGLYIHVPFCASKCPYCDFNTYARIEPLIPEYLGALEAEITLWGRLLDRPGLSTVYFGGGTPSYLPGGAIAGIASATRLAFAVGPDAEVTSEANPDDCSAERLADMRAAGVNRLSIGVQSLDDGLLRVLGRRHDSAAAVQAVRSAHDAGFDNVSIDLMFGLPGQTIAQWTSTLERALGLQPEHVSIYGLTIEPGTPFAADVAGGRLPAPDDDLAADMYEHTMARLAQAGYRHYEISNWCRPARESVHNLAYWRNAGYLGVGPGAHSYLGQYRFANLRPPREYVRRAGALARRAGGPAPDGNPWRDAVLAMQAAGIVETADEVSPSLEMAETMMMGLRLDQGIDAGAFQERFGVDLDACYAGQIADLSALGLVESDRSGLRLTPRGRILGNEVFQRFMLVPSATGS